ncbi:MAG TPA: ABC transporter ATP-binding protein [Rhizomicrobium sp.]|nr:ABC transporter ATP-binding protein [Rhizomicrobium sp.]
MTRTPLLAIANLCVETAPRDGAPGRVLLQDFSMDIMPGEFVSVVGESGSGKTMAARAILDLLPPGTRRGGGSIRLSGRELTTLSARQMRQVRGGEVGMVFQEPMVSLNPALTIGRQLEEGLALHRDYDRSERRDRIIEMLRRVRISEPEKRLAAYPHEFSGGMRQRIMLASVMLLRPKLLVADEPTTALDMLSQRDVMEVMTELARDEGVAVLLITHDLRLVARYTQRMVVVEKGKLVEKGETAQVLRAPSDPYTRKLIDSLPKFQGGKADRGIDRPPLLSVENASLCYEGRVGWLFGGAPKPVVREVSLTVGAGETVALVGASGSGKTTLGRAVLGLKALSAGAIKFDGLDIARMNAADMRKFRRTAQLVFQDPFSSLDPRLKIGEIVGAPLRHEPISTFARRLRVEKMLSEVGLPGFADRFAHQISGGQRQRVAIARAIVSWPRLVVADEPVSALDATIQRQVLSLLQKLQDQYGFACLFITHDLAVVGEIADRVAVMSEGCIVEAGETQTVFAAPQHSYTQALLAATPQLFS